MSNMLFRTGSVVYRVSGSFEGQQSPNIPRHIIEVAAIEAAILWAAHNGNQGYNQNVPPSGSNPAYYPSTK